MEIPLPFRVEFSVEKVWKFWFSFIDLTRWFWRNSSMNAKKVADSIRAEIVELEKRCECLKKIATELEKESGGEIISDKTAQQVITLFKKSKLKKA